MEVTRVDVKIWGRRNRPLEDLLPVLHGWVTQGVLGETWVDVVPYVHVPQGPGIVGIAHHGLYGLDERGGIFGLRYQDRRPRGTRSLRPLAECVRDAAGRVLAAAQRLLAEIGGEDLAFDPARWTVGICDRLHVPPDDAAVKRTAHALVRDALLDATGAASAHLEPDDDPRRGLRWHVTLCEPGAAAAMLRG